MITLFSETRRHPKIVKNGIERNVYSIIMHLAPGNISGHEVCPMRSAGCTVACLHTAGYHHTRKYAARIARTKWFFDDREAFMEQMGKEIDRHRNYAHKHGYLFGIRLNGTSDIPWESFKFGKWKNVMERYSAIPFYDYTKRLNRKNLPKNYRLTYSRSENTSPAQIAQAFDAGMNVAVVFKTGKDEKLPDYWDCRPVIDGDAHDWRFDDPSGVIVGLRAKGKARHDASGFVV